MEQGASTYFCSHGPPYINIRHRWYLWCYCDWLRAAPKIEFSFEQIRTLLKFGTVQENVIFCKVLSLIVDVSVTRIQ